MIYMSDDFNSKKTNDGKCYFEFVFEPIKMLNRQNEILRLSKQILKENEQLKRQLLVEKTIAECMANLRRQKND